MKTKKKVRIMMEFRSGTGCPEEFGLEDHPGCNIDGDALEMHDDCESCWKRALFIMEDGPNKEEDAKTAREIIRFKRKRGAIEPVNASSFSGCERWNNRYGRLTMDIKEDSGRKIAQRMVEATKCKKCGETEGRLERHHMDGNPLNNTIENIMVLCVPCHRRIHKRFKYEPESVECPVCGKIFTRKRRDRNLVCGVGCKGKYISMVSQGKIVPDPDFPIRDK